MAEALAVAGSIIAVIQLADRIATVCKFFIESAQDYPRDLRLIYVETGSLKVIFEGLSFLDQENPADWTALKALQGDNGPLERCKTAVAELDKLFPPLPSSTGLKAKRGKKEMLQMALASLAWSMKADKAKRLLDEIMRYKSTIGVALQGQLLTDVRNMRRQLDRISVVLSASEKRKAADWFRGAMPQGTSSHELHNAAKRLYEDKTGDWVFETSEWNNWINCRKRALWIHGIPGAGKTVLASYVIERTLGICETRGKRTRCIYYYCYHGHNQDEMTPFLRWLVGELLVRLDETPEAAWEAWLSNTAPDFQLLLRILEDALGSFDRVFVGIDALDESQSRAHLLALLEKFITEPRFAKIQLFATSREYEDVRRKMSSISQPLSMSNPYVEADIRLYVAAKIRDNPRFQRWPQDLRIEAEDALSSGAKGMFRWAVCQLDILRRLHHQSKIREAIRSLPETLDETYERIFSCIDEEELELVRCTIHLICFHNFLWEGNVPLPALVLLDYYAVLDKTENRLSPHDFLHDLDTLKEACGCLVSFSYAGGGETANIAHYTVREFLESSRASSLLTASMKIGHKDRHAILASMFEYATTSIKHKDISDLYSYDPLVISGASNLRKYCLASSLQSFVGNEELVEPSLAFKFLDPCQAHYEDLQHAVDLPGDIDAIFLRERLWTISWVGRSESSKAAILISLLSMKCLALAQVLMRDLDMKGLMQEVLNGEIASTLWLVSAEPGSVFEPVQLKGSLVDMLCQIGKLDKGTLCFLQQEPSILIDYGNILPCYMLGHDFCRGTHEDDCVLQQLLCLGAHPDPKGCRVTPLQISVYKRDLDGVKSLLEAGADPNHRGDPRGVAGDDENSLFPFELHGVAPVDILHQFEPPDYLDVFELPDEEEHMRSGIRDIENLLRAYGSWPPEGGWRQGSDEESEAVDN